MDQEHKWYLVQCKPREVFRAEEHLNNQAYRCFHPTHLVKRKVAGRVQLVVESLFSNYLFIYLSHIDNWSTIRSTRGVSKIVHFNGRPASVDHNLIYELQRQCAKLHGHEPEPIHKIGDRVMVNEGCFNELEAVVKATRADDRVILLINLLNRPQSIELSVHSVVGLV